METGEHLLEFTEKLPGKDQQADNERNNRIINSTISYLAAYVSVYVFFHLATAFVAKRKFLLTKFYYFKLEFSQNSDLWQLEPVRWTFVTGSLLCLGLGIILLFVQKMFRKRPGILKMFILWLGIHFLNFFCCELALLPIKTTSESYKYSSYLGIFFDYMYWDSDFVKLIFSIVSFLILIVIGAVVSKPFIQLSNSTQHVYKSENRFYFLFQMVFIPFVAGSIVSLIYFADGLFILNITSVFTMFVIIVSLFINGMKNRMIMIYRLPESGQIENKFMIALAAGLILMKLFFNDGIKF